jgi:hypothetical protein
LPSHDEVFEVLVEAADEGPPTASRRFSLGDCVSRLAEGRQDDGTVTWRDPAVLGVVEGAQVRVAEALDEAVRGAARAVAALHESLVLAEEPLEFVCRGRDARVVEADEEV